MELHLKTPIERIIIAIQKFAHQEKAGGIVLGLSVFIALLIANTPLANAYHHFFEHKFGFQWNGKSFFNFSLHHWINDGLMSVFFFVVGLELKREITGGELSEPKKAILPIAAALGGMLFPALIFLTFNPSGEMHKGWGIPMATDIAFALGVLHLLGKRIPVGLKIFLTALAIVDDLGAVLVIAFFYTSDISIFNLILGLGFILIMFAGNKMGIRSILFYAVIGILGVWVTFSLSGIHATIAAVLAAFTIPAEVKIKEHVFVLKVKNYLAQFRAIDPDNSRSTLTGEQLHLLDKIKVATVQAMPPLQKLEHAMHPLVTFIVIPVFALANAGVTVIDIDPSALFSTNIVLGVGLGLLVGKVIGVVGFTWLTVRLKIAALPQGMNMRNLLGLGLLASIGFTMSLFVTSLAFSNEEYIMQSKVGIFAASIAGGILGFIILKRSTAH